MTTRCDFHTHTTASDGSFTPEELVRYAKEKQTAVLAVTDHDTIGGLARALAEGKRIGQQVIPGIEITTRLEGCEIHLIGLFVDWQDPGFASRIDVLSKTRDLRNMQMIEKLRAHGFAITRQDLSRFSGSILTKAHIGQILVERGYAATVMDAVNAYLRKGGIGYVERVTPAPGDAISLIHQAKGLAFVAHTNQIDRNSRDHSCELCRRLLRIGADGLETRYCEFDNDWRCRTEAIAEEFRCLRSGGSDFHGTFKKGLDLLNGYGDLEVPYAFYEAMQQKRRLPG